MEKGLEHLCYLSSGAHFNKTDFDQYLLKSSLFSNQFLTFSLYVLLNSN